MEAIDGPERGARFRVRKGAPQAALDWLPAPTRRALEAAVYARVAALARAGVRCIAVARRDCAPPSSPPPTSDGGGGGGGGGYAVRRDRDSDRGRDRGGGSGGGGNGRYALGTGDGSYALGTGGVGGGQVRAYSSVASPPSAGWMGLGTGWGLGANTTLRSSASAAAAAAAGGGPEEAEDGWMEVGEWRLVGLVAFTDPVRPDARKTLLDARKMGLDVKMLTGLSLLLAFRLGA